VSHAPFGSVLAHPSEPNKVSKTEQIPCSTECDAEAACCRTGVLLWINP
jgi:hypothetical protein